MCQRAHAAGLGSPELCASASEHGCDSREVGEDGGRWTVGNWRFRVSQLTKNSMLAGLCKKRRRWKGKTSNLGQLRTFATEEVGALLLFVPSSAPHTARDPPPSHPWTPASGQGLPPQTKSGGSGSGSSESTKSDHEKRKRREVSWHNCRQLRLRVRNSTRSLELQRPRPLDFINPTAPASDPFQFSRNLGSIRAQPASVVGFPALHLLGSAFIIAFLARLHQHCIGPQSCTTLDRTLSRIDQH